MTFVWAAALVNLVDLVVTALETSESFQAHLAGGRRRRCWPSQRNESNSARLGSLGFYAVLECAGRHVNNHTEGVHTLFDVSLESDSKEFCNLEHRE